MSIHLRYSSLQIFYFVLLIKSCAVSALHLWSQNSGTYSGLLEKLIVSQMAKKFPAVYEA
jgi:hypothetical protein